MKPNLLPAAVVTLILTGQAVRGVDLAKIERSIRKEPAYQTNAPKYGLLVFGLEAKARAWVVLDGDFLYVDRNCNGDLTDDGERFVIKKNWALNRDKTKPGKWVVGDNVPVAITEPDGTKHQIIFRRTARGIGLAAKSLGGQYVGATYREDLVFADRPRDAPIVHLNGPFTFLLADAPKKWAPGETVDFVVLFGTPGIGKGSFAYPIQSFKTRPVADIQFPAKKPGDPPITLQVALKECSRARFVGG